MKNWLEQQAKYWLKMMPLELHRNWLERQVSIWLYYTLSQDKADCITPLRPMLFGFWLVGKVIKSK